MSGSEGLAGVRAATPYTWTERSAGMVIRYTRRKPFRV